MGKKRKAPGRPQERRVEEPDNLFERLSNKKRFNILGRKLKGETRELGKLRTAATDRVRLWQAATTACRRRLPPAPCLPAACLPACRLPACRLPARPPTRPPACLPAGASQQRAAAAV